MGATEVFMWSLNGTNIHFTSPMGQYFVVSTLDIAGQILRSTSVVQ